MTHEEIMQAYDAEIAATYALTRSLRAICPDGFCGADDCTRCRPDNGVEVVDGCSKQIVADYSDQMFGALCALINPNRRVFKDRHAEDIEAAIKLINQINDDIERSA